MAKLARLVLGLNPVAVTKTLMFTSSICDYSDAYILVKGNITVAGEERDAAAIRRDKIDKQTTSKIVQSLPTV